MYYMSWVLDSIVAEARKANLDVTDLKGDECTRENLSRVLGEKKASLYIHGAHGACNALSTQEMKIIICSPRKGFCSSEDTSSDASIGCESPNQEWFKGVVCYNLACLSGRWLGVDKVDSGALAVLAYDDSLYLLSGEEADYYWTEEVFRDAFIAGAKALIWGKTTAEAREAIEAEYNAKIEWVRHNHPECPDVITYLRADRDRLVLLGSEEVRIRE
jgi:hypothetical protein